MIIRQVTERVMNPMCRLPGLHRLGPGDYWPPACGRQQELNLLYWGLLALMPSSGYLPVCEQRESNPLCWGKEVENPHAVSYSRARK